MAGQTPFYGLTFFDFRDRFDLPINVRKEIERFLLIDKQLYGLYTIFGNGVIRGWNLQEPEDAIQQNSISVTVTPGIGIIGLLATETTLPEVVQDLPSNDTVDIWAILTGGTINNRDVQFIWSRTAPSDSAVRLGRVATGSNEIVSIDSSFRDEIGFIELIKEEIAKHKHRGTPTKIDLQQETRNQLPGARMEDFDASKIISGRFDVERIPKLDHNDLENNGLLTHAALDSFVRTITAGNRELLGEVGSVNLMRLLTSWKYKYPIIDDGFINSMTVIPGVTDSRFIDFDASTAWIDLSSQCISGRPTSIGQIRSIIWETTTAFLTAYDRNLVTIANDQVFLTRGGSSAQFIENFEQVTSGGQNIPGFTTATQVISDDLEVISNDSDGFRTQGFYGGEFKTDRSFRAIYTKTINVNKDWSLFDELVVDVKSLAITHGSVYMYFVHEEADGTEVKSQDYLLLGPDEITSNPDPNANGFEQRSFSIANATRGNVSRLVFYTDDIVTKHKFYIDNIFLRNQALFPPEGFIRFRFSSGVPVTFSSLIWESEEPDGTELRVRIRTANSPSLLNRAVFTSPLNSGDVFSLSGTDCEIDIQLFSNDERTATPVLDFLELQIIIDSEEVGFTITDAEDWDRGSYINTEREFDDFTFDSFISIADPVPVNNVYYSFKNVISEVDPDGTAVSGFQGARFLLSPKQAKNFFTNQGQRGFKFPFSVYRLESRNFLLADLDNDRLLEVQPDGTFVRGLGSHNESDDTFFYPMTAVYNPRTGVLTTTFSQEVDGDDLQIGNVRLWIGGSPINLGANDTVLAPTKTTRILEIQLSPDKVAQLRDTQSIVTVQYLPASFPTEFSLTQSAQELIGIQGLEVFIGDFVFIDGIRRPVFGNILANGNWIAGNSSIFFEEAGVGGTTTRIEVQVGQSESFQLEVDPPEDGFFVQWQVTIPTEVNNIVSFSAPPPGNRATVNIANPSEDQVGEFTLTFIAEYRDINTQEVVSSTQNQAVLAIVPEGGSDSGGDDSTEQASIIEVNRETEEVVFNYDSVKFSDFSLGSVYEVDENNFLIAGIVQIDDTMVDPGDAAETFEEQAAQKLAQYRGKVVIVDRNTKAISFQYDTPDGSYASDAVIDTNNNFVVAETSFVSNSGRVVKLDSFGNVIFQIGGGTFSKINDVRALVNGNVFIST
tara:strand:+ start:315691 stop:319212 length:3522 start_codon:yes stop_codon:yes gene_type:complete